MLAIVWIENSMLGTYDRTTSIVVAMLFVVLFFLFGDFRSGCYSGQNECIRESENAIAAQECWHELATSAHTFPVVRDVSRCDTIFELFGWIRSVGRSIVLFAAISVEFHLKRREINSCLHRLYERTKKKIRTSPVERCLFCIIIHRSIDWAHFPRWKAKMSFCIVVYDRRLASIKIFRQRSSNEKSTLDIFTLYLYGHHRHPSIWPNIRVFHWPHAVAIRSRSNEVKMQYGKRGAAKKKNVQRLCKMNSPIRHLMLRKFSVYYVCACWHRQTDSQTDRQTGRE